MIKVSYSACSHRRASTLVEGPRGTDLGTVSRSLKEIPRRLSTEKRSLHIVLATGETETLPIHQVGGDIGLLQRSG